MNTFSSFRACLPAAILLLLLFGAAVALETGEDDYLLTLACITGLWVMQAVSLNITNGFAGLFSLGHPAFMMLGGYAAAIMVMSPGRKESFLEDLPLFLVQMEWPLLPAILLGGLVAAIIAFLFGAPVLRLRGHYLAVATLAFTIIVASVISNLDGLTRGPLGLNGLPTLTTIWWAWGGAALTVAAAWGIKFSSLGRMMAAVRDDELAAATSGIPVAAVKLTAFVIGAFFAGISGGLFAHLVSVITPTSFSISTAFMLVVVIVVGGSGSITGSVVIAIAFTVFTEAIKPLESHLELYGLSQMVVSLLLLVSLLIRPSGLFGEREPSLFRPRSLVFRPPPL